MCGLAGYIGGSKNNQVTFDLITSLFDQIEVRGVDAAGFWGVRRGLDKDEDTILYHKEPIKTSDFIKRAIWLKVREYHPNLLLVHARGASVGMGIPANNKNNHPFTSSCKNIGMVHNGRITEYDGLKKKFEVRSDCDSEILLRIFEASINSSSSVDEFTQRIQAIREIWRHVPRGAMAVAIGERLDAGARRLFLFRNKLRSLWLADVRKTLGQIYFFSTPEIWSYAVQNCNNNVYRHVKKAKLIEFPPDEVWAMSITASDQVVSLENVKKFEIQKKGTTNFECRGELVKIVNKPVTTELMTRLNENDDIITLQNAKEDERPGKVSKTQIPKASRQLTQSTQSTEPDDELRDAEVGDLEDDTNNEEECIMDDYSQQISHEHVTMTCEKIKNLIGSIAVEVENRCCEQSMSIDKYQDLATSLEQTELDLEGTLTMLRS